MRREKIILSDLDLKILEYVYIGKFIKEIVKTFDIDYLMIKVHLDRLRKIECIETNRLGTFKKIAINNRGKNLLNVLKWK